MRLIPSDPDIETIVGRIENGDLDLQPTFQRGEVWGRQKKQKLIDSVLRDWHIPPIHVVERKDSGRQEVLDGQQRLVSIRDFCRNELVVDGAIEPADPAIAQLHGLKYRQLPDELRRRFNQFTIRVFRIVDYSASEAGELFYRLNQPTSLTGAEQRNAFVGPVREQIKRLAAMFAQAGLDDKVLGFSNARMAYDDVTSRVAVSIMRGTLSQKITATDLADLYRRTEPLTGETVALIELAIRDLGQVLSVDRRDPTEFDQGSCIEQPSEPVIRFNKATLYTWLLFFVRMRRRIPVEVPAADLAEFRRNVDDLRSSYEEEGGRKDLETLSYLHRLVSTYQERSSSRVADVASVMLRDACLWLLLRHFLSARGSTLTRLVEHLTDRPYALIKAPQGSDDELYSRSLIESGWGQL